MVLQKKKLNSTDVSGRALAGHPETALGLDDFPEPGLYSAGDLQSWRWRKSGRPKINPPDAVIICLQSDLLHYARKRYPLKTVKGFFGDLFLVKKWRGRVALAGGFGLGAPAMAALIEEFCAFGVRRFLSIGTAGSLQPSLAAGHVVVCQRAVRGEGASRHYLPPAETVEADPQMLAVLQSALDLQEIQFTGGAAWTTDAPYRETRREVDRQRAAGTLAVEMEAAALFAAARGLGARAAAALVIADRLLPGRWIPPEAMEPVQHSLQAVLDASLPRLASV